MVNVTRPNMPYYPNEAFLTMNYDEKNAKHIMKHNRSLRNVSSLKFSASEHFHSGSRKKISIPQDYYKAFPELKTKKDVMRESFKKLTKQLRNTSKQPSETYESSCATHDTT